MMTDGCVRGLTLLSRAGGGCRCAWGVNMPAVKVTLFTTISQLPPNSIYRLLESTHLSRAFKRARAGRCGRETEQCEVRIVVVCSFIRSCAVLIPFLSIYFSSKDSQGSSNSLRKSPESCSPRRMSQTVAGGKKRGVVCKRGNQSDVPSFGDLL